MDPEADTLQTDETPWEDAYASHFNLVLNTILYERDDFRELFSAEEIAIASKFLVLSPLQQQLYSRLFQRQGFWFKTMSLFRYFHERGKTAIDDDQHQLPDHKQVQETIQELVEVGYVNKFPSESDNRGNEEAKMLELALDAIKHCAAAPELVALHKKMTGRNKAAGKADTFAAVKRVVKTQRRIDGSRIPIAKFMQEIWYEAFPLAGKRERDIMVLQMDRATRDLLLRMHRLFYFMSSPPFNATSSMPSKSENAAEIIAAASQKLREEPTQWPGLMALFKKVAYPEYELAKSPEATGKQVVNRHRVFASPEAYACYEVAYQLHRVVGVVEQCIQIETPESNYQEPDLELKWMLTDSVPVFTAFQKLLLLLDDNEDTETEEEFVVGDAVKKSTGSWQLESWETFYVDVGQMQSLDELVLAARSCLHAYLKWMNAATFNGTCSMGVPVFFAKCNAGYHLVRILHTAVGLYEKKRKYQIATLLLNELLAAPFLERKRGYWWDRLALNLEHLKCTDQAQATCLNALEDPHVLAVDRIALERRSSRLQRQKDRRDQALPDTGSTEPSQTTDMASDDVKDEVKASVTYEYRKTYIVGRPLNRQTGEKSRFIGYDDEPCTVEQLVLQYYRDYFHSEDLPQKQTRGGWYGVHSEGSVLRNLFGILMWDVLYASVPDVFQTPFQSAPLDFGYAELFYASRRDLIERRLSQVRDTWSTEELLTAFATRWTNDYGKVSRFVHWPSDETASLQFHLLVLAAIGRRELANLLHYMASAKEFHQAQNGLPDLLLLRLDRSGQSPSQASEWALDGHGCLNVFAFCGMDEALNMNEKVAADSGDLVTDIVEEAAMQPLERVRKVCEEGGFIGHLKLVEVKGPRDRLSDKQLLWLRVLAEEVGLDATVMHVEEKEKQAKRTKKATESASKRQVKRRK